MSNILGIDYYRLVSETGGNEWAQVYVKVAFDKQELSRFGSVFGVVKLSGGDNLVEKGEQLMEKIEKFCSELSHKGDVTGLLALLEGKMASGVFAWVFVDDSGLRKIKIGALPGNSAIIRRSGNRVWLFENGDGRIVVGELREGDQLYFGAKEVVGLIDEKVAGEREDIGKLTDEVFLKMASLAEGARAAILLVVKPMSRAPEKVYQEEVVQRIEKRREEEELVKDKVVGASGLAGKFATAKLSWKDFVLNWQQAKRLPVEENGNKRRRLFLLVGMIFLIVLGVSVTLGLVKAKKAAAEAAYRTVFDPLEKKRVEAESLFALNPVGARDLLRSVKQEEAAKKGSFAKTDFEKRIADFEKAVEVSWEKVSGERKASLDPFFSLGLIRDQMKGERLAFDGEGFLVLDSTSGIVAKVSYPDKKQEVILGKGEGQNWLDVAGLTGSNVLLTKGGLTAILAGKTVNSKFDLAVVDPVATDVFPGAAYVLDKGASEIWRYGLSGGAIGERRRWLLAGVEADLHGGVDMAIDMDIWVGLGGGKVMKFRRGQFEKFSLSDVPEEFKITRLAVSGDNNVMAVLDSGKGRIVLFNKDTGAYMSQLLAPEFSTATDLVWVNDHQLMILVGDKMFLTSI